MQVIELLYKSSAPGIEPLKNGPLPFMFQTLENWVEGRAVEVDLALALRLCARNLRVS